MTTDIVHKRQFTKRCLNLNTIISIFIQQTGRILEDYRDKFFPWHGDDECGIHSFLHFREHEGNQNVSQFFIDMCDTHRLLTMIVNMV